MEIKTRKKCAICRNRITQFLDLGMMPLANHLLLKEELKKHEKLYPLTLCFCENCGLVQLGQIVSPEVMFKDYLYIPSMSKTLVNHFEELCNTIISQSKKKQGFVIDIGSNDGSLLRFFKTKNFKVLGVDPAEKIAQAATSAGIETLPVLFNLRKAKEIVKKYGYADVVTATNVFAHVEDLDDIYAGVSHLLADDGVAVVEVSYLRDMMEKTLFDAIYHEHLYYFAIKPLVKLFEKTGLELFKAERINMHGGSLRLWLRKKAKRNTKMSKSVAWLLQEEKKIGLNDLTTYINFKNRIGKIKKTLLKLLLGIKEKNKTIVGFGAPAKGNILLNYFAIDNAILNYIVDSTTYKQFRYAPGVHLQVLPEETIYIDKPDYLLVLAWNFADEIAEKHRNFKGKFIIPLPDVQLR
jgi:hypothetical protein